MARIERSRKAATLIVMQLRDKDQHTVKGRSQHLHEQDSDIRVDPVVASPWLRCSGRFCRQTAGDLVLDLGAQPASRLLSAARMTQVPT